MSTISGMDEVIAFIDRQYEKIKALQTNEKVREEFIVELKKKVPTKEGVEKTAKVICDNWKEIDALREENEWMLNEKAELKRENEKLKADNETLEEKITCLESDSHNEVSLAEYEELQEENEKLKKENDDWKNIDMGLLKSEYMMKKDSEIFKLKKEIEELKKKDEEDEEEVKAYCPKCDWEGKCCVSKTRAKELAELGENEDIGENDFCGCNYPTDEEED